MRTSSHCRLLHHPGGVTFTVNRVGITSKSSGNNYNYAIFRSGGDGSFLAVTNSVVSSAAVTAHARQTSRTQTSRDSASLRRRASRRTATELKCTGAPATTRAEERTMVPSTLRAASSSISTVFRSRGTRPPRAGAAAAATKKTAATASWPPPPRPTRAAVRVISLSPPLPPSRPPSLPYDAAPVDRPAPRSVFCATGAPASTDKWSIVNGGSCSRYTLKNKATGSHWSNGAYRQRLGFIKLIFCS